MRQWSLYFFFLPLVIFFLYQLNFSFYNDNKTKKSLAYYFPADTLLYIEVDIHNLLKNSKKYMDFFDPEMSRNVINEAIEFRKTISTYLKSQEMNAKLLDHLHESRFYYISYYLDKPIVIKKTQKKYLFDKQTKIYKYVDEEYEETEWMNKAFLLEINPAIASHFLKEFKLFINKMKEKNPESKDYNWKSVEIDQGELIQLKDFYVGRIKNYIVFSKLKPDKIWHYTRFPSENPLSETKLFKRFKMNEASSQLLLLFNLNRFLVQAEKELVIALDETKVKAKKSDKSNDWRVKSAKNDLDLFRLTKNLLSYEKLQYAGASIGVDVYKNHVKTNYRFSLHHKNPISPFLKSILNGGKKFQYTGLDLKEYMILMFRLEISNMRKTIAKNIDAKSLTQSNLINGMSKIQIGYTIDEILNAFAGDMYFFFNEKDILDETKPIPEIFVLFGLNNGMGFSEMLSNIYTKLSLKANFQDIIKKKVYLETNVYTIKPDRKLNFAMVVLNRYVSFGTMEGIKRLIRKTKVNKKKPGTKLKKILHQNRQANLLFILSKNLVKRESMKQNKEQVKTFMKLLSLLKIKDNQMNEKIQGHLKRLLKHLKLIDEKSLKNTPDKIIFKGEHKHQFYDLEAKIQIHK